MVVVFDNIQGCNYESARTHHPGGLFDEEEISFFLVLAASLLAVALASASETGSGIGADEALKKLIDGNAHLIANQLTITDSSGPGARQALAAGQKPFAIILSCSDSRVPPEIIFDQGLGEIFVVRVAGNIPDPVIIGSIEYAAEHFNCPLIMVLGTNDAAP